MFFVLFFFLLFSFVKSTTFRKSSKQKSHLQNSKQPKIRFEKLDITPKSAQKIKPVLERWMKEAEER